MSLAYGLIAQTTTLINPTTDGGFEGSHGWTLVNSPDLSEPLVCRECRAAFTGK
jgi:hypothetical protein